MIITTIIMVTMHGVFISPLNQATDGTLTLLGYMMPMIMGIMTILGFGLIFSFNKKLLYSGLGFTFFITAFVLQFYPLINAFWTNTNLMGESVHSVKTPNFNDDEKDFPFYLGR